MLHRLRHIAGAGILFFGMAGAAIAQSYGINGQSCTYTSLAQAITAAGNNGEVYVRSGSRTVSNEITLPFNITIRSGTSQCQATNSRATLTDGGANRLFRVPPGRRLTLINMNLTGGRPTGLPREGGTIRLESGALLGLANSRVRGGATPGNGGCIFGLNARISLIGNSSVENCNSGGSGGGIYLDGGSLTVLRGSIKNSFATVDGGNIFAIRDADIRISGTVSGGQARRDGGGIALVKDRFGISIAEPTLTLSGRAVVAQNTAGDDGGGISTGHAENLRVSTIEITIADSTRIQNNSADDRGGGIATDSEGAIITISDSASFTGNSAQTGGAIHASASNISIRDRAVFRDNEARSQGGAISVSDGGQLDSRGSALDRPVRFEQNRLTDNSLANNQGGGAIYTSGTPVNLRFTRLSNNSARSGPGGGVRASNGAEVLVENSQLAANIARIGGGIAISGGRLRARTRFRDCTVAVQPSTVDYCTRFTSNRASGFSNRSLNLQGLGGAIYGDFDTVLDLRTTEFRGNVAAGVGNSAGQGSILAVSGTGGASQALLLNGMLVSNRATQEVSSALFNSGSVLNIRNNTFVDNSIPYEWDSSASGVFNNNIVSGGLSVQAPWPSSIPGSCNLFGASTSGVNPPLPTGSNNEIRAVSLDNNHHPRPTSTHILDKCSSGPTFDVLGTRRPVNGAYDRGAVELP